MRQFQIWALRVGAYNVTRKPLFHFGFRWGCWCGRRYTGLSLGRYFIAFELPHLDGASYAEG